eukprot:1599254-Rhodomonas_salina.1
MLVRVQEGGHVTEATKAAGGPGTGPGPAGRGGGSSSSASASGLQSHVTQGAPASARPVSVAARTTVLFQVAW